MPIQMGCWEHEKINRPMPTGQLSRNELTLIEERNPGCPLEVLYLVKEAGYFVGFGSFGKISIDGSDICTTVLSASN
jgi:hypothetical protein